MCGIVGYVGSKDSIPVLLRGLKRLEYRGYDSAGVAVLHENNLHFIKKAGKVSSLQSFIDEYCPFPVPGSKQLPCPLQSQEGGIQFC